MSGCLSCLRGFHEECESQPCCCGSIEEGEIKEADEESDENIESPQRGRPQKDEITVSAGRKRAASEYPLRPKKLCEWGLRSNCGGGLYPIFGCQEGRQIARHHGPDKDTSNNDETNIHLICTSCHNRWHAANDKYYDKETNTYKDAKGTIYTPQELPHSPTFWIAPEVSDGGSNSSEKSA